MQVIRVVRPLLLPVCRAVYWTPLLIAGTVMPALAALVGAATGGMTPGEALTLLRLSVLSLGAAAAFTLADDMAVNTAALPSPRWLRQWLRTFLALGSAAIGWTATYLAATTWSADSLDLPLAAIALEATVSVTIGLTGAAFGVRRVPDRHGAVAGMATVFAAFVGSLFLPGDWSPWLSPGDPRWDAAHNGWLLVVLVTMAALMIAHRDTRRTTMTMLQALRIHANRDAAPRTGLVGDGSAATQHARSRRPSSPRSLRTSRPAVAIPLTMLCTIAAAMSAMVATPLFDRSSPLAQPAAGLAVALGAVLLVHLWRRYLLRRPWSGVGLPWRRSAISEFIVGVVIAAAAVAVANTVSVLAGVASWVSWLESDERFGVVVLAILTVSIVQQGFPEELLWRGHLGDLLSDSLSPRTALMLTSVVFGLLHIVSSSGAATLGERLLYIVMAVALGFACGAARVRTGAAWMAVGVHSGFHIGLRGIPTEPSNYAAWLVLLTSAMSVAGLLILGRSWSGAAQPPQEATTPSRINDVC